jgi:hypothetical protein
MQMIALEPKELYKLCADGRNEGRNMVDLKCCEPICGLPTIFFPGGVLHGYAGGL